MPQGYSDGDVVYLLTIPSLCIGLGNYIVLPLALAFGRRPVFLGSIIVLLASLVWAAVNNSYESHLGARIVQGLATGATESVLPLMPTEVTFLHQRNRVFGMYWMTQTVFSGILNIKPIPLAIADATTSGAIDTFVQCVAHELPRGIRINVVNPTVLEEAWDVYGEMMPGFQPVPGALVGKAFERSVDGFISGQVLYVDA